MNDLLDSRALAAVRFVDGTTGATVLTGLEVTSPTARLLRNRSGLHVVTAATGLPGYDRSFAAAPPPPPALGDVKVVLTVRDREGRYLPRAAEVALPRDADPAHAGAADSLFRPLDVPLFLAPTARPQAGWARVRASVRRAGSGVAIANAFLRVHRAGDVNDVLARGFSDARGEGFVPVAGIPAMNWSSSPDHPVLATGIDVVVVAFVDPTVDPTDSDTFDPAAIEARRDTLPSTSVALHLSSGREVSARFTFV